MAQEPPKGASLPATAPQRGSPLEVLGAFLKLGLTSFGGPVAHLGYFRTEFVERRKWLDEKSYSDLVALCQFLPGPASSQVGMALGQQRAGWLGSLMAWIGFTMPSALALILFAYGIAQYSDLAASGAVHGLKVVAVAVVAQAVWGMAKSLCPDNTRAALAIFSALLTLVLPSWLGQVGAILACGLIGWWTVKLAHEEPVPHIGYLAFFAAKSGEEGFSVQEIPLDPELLDTPAYKKFLEVRRERIANRLNLFISG